MSDSAPIIIREAVAAEYDAVRALLLAAYDEYRPQAAGLAADAWEMYARDIVDIEGRLPDGVPLVAEQAGRLIGTVTYYPRGDQGQHWPADYAALRLLGVHPNARGLGLGRRLTEACLERARAQGSTHLGLHTTVWMATAKAMYLRMGFHPRPDQDFHYGNLTIEAFALPLTS